MIHRPTALRVLPLALLAGLVATGCAQPPAISRSQGTEAAQGQTSQRSKVLNLVLRTILDAFSIAASPTLAGGGLGYIETHSQALFTADQNTGRPIPACSRSSRRWITVDSASMPTGRWSRPTGCAATSPG